MPPARATTPLRPFASLLARLVDRGRADLAPLSKKIGNPGTRHDPHFLHQLGLLVTEIELDPALNPRLAADAREALSHLVAASGGPPQELTGPARLFGETVSPAERPPLLEEIPPPFPLRDYQTEWVARVLRSIASGSDRTLVRAAWQSGKTILIPYLVRLARERLFPGKKVLILAPRDETFEVIRQDLRQHFRTRFGFWGHSRKSRGPDNGVLLAMIPTLAHGDNMRQLNPNDYGLVIVDEASFCRSDGALRCLQHLGFLGADSQITSAKGRHLLGLTADPVNLQPLFGTQPTLWTHGFQWYIEKGYLQRVRRVQVDYPESIQMVQSNMGLGLVPQTADEACRVIVDTYRKMLDGKRVLIFVNTTADADRLAGEFCREFGDGFAVANHSALQEGLYRESKSSYLTKDRTKVLVCVHSLDYSFRAFSTEGVIMATETGSLRAYGQRLGRALGVSPGEPQREVLLIDMQGGVGSLRNPASLPRLLGREDDRSEGSLPAVTIYKPVSGGSFFFSFRPVSRDEAGISATTFPRLLRAHLEKRFHRDLFAMAERLGLDLDDLDSYLNGGLPRSADEVRQIAKGLDLDEDSLLDSWGKEAFRIIEALYPLPEGTPPSLARFIQLVRKMVLHEGKGSIHSAAGSEKEDFPAGLYQTLKYAFSGELPGTARTARNLYEALVSSGIANPTEIRQLMTAAYLVSGTRVTDPEETGFDPLCLDALDQGVEPVGLDEERLGSDPEGGLGDPPPPDQEDLLGEKRRLEGIPKRIAEAMRVLTPMELRIFRWRNGLDPDTGEETGEVKLLKEIGDFYNLSRERIRTLEEQALEKLRRSLKSAQT